MIYKIHKLVDGTETSAHFSECMKYRYVLYQFWKGSLNKRLVFILLNLSTATEIADDRTIIRCRNRAIKGDYYGVTVINLFAFRATNPEDMKKADDPIGPINIAILQNELSCAQKGTAEIIFGWAPMGASAIKIKRCYRGFSTTALRLWL